MNHVTFDNPEARAALLRAARGSILKPVFGGILAVLATAAGGGAFALAAGFLPGPSAVVALGCGALVALLVSRLLATVIAGLAVRPVELLLEQIDASDLDSFRWDSGRALSRSEIGDDVKLLQRRVREVMRRSRGVIEELERAREQANHQNLAKSQFLAKMSHELRTPLNAILGYAMLLHEDASEAGDASTMADLDRIQQAGRNLLALINDILDLSKIDTGRTTVDRVAIDVQTLAASVASACDAHDLPNGNRFEMTVDESIGIMVGDAAMVRRCLTNLLGNAFKFTRDGLVTLEISPLRQGESSWVEFSVRDTGIGIAPEHMTGLFDAFRQLDGSATRQFSGAGLGLAIVQRLATLMNGECRVESVVGQGSTFRLILPLGDLPAPIADGDETAADVPATRVETPSAEHTALVVDDDEATIELMQRWLVRMGYNVVFTTSAGNVVELARMHQPDFILLDVLLPGRSGYDVLEELRADPEVGHIPTILITVEDDRARGLRAGATDYLRKPITAPQLRSVLDVYRLRATGEILVIDDDDASAELLARSVAQVGFSARRAADGVEGLAMAAAAKPDAIVLDLAMPLMDGFEVLDRLAATEGLRDVPLIVVSGRDITIEQHRRLASAGHRFFPKAASTPREIAQSLKELVP